MARKAPPAKQSAAKKPAEKTAKKPAKNGKKAATDESQAPSGKLAPGGKAPNFNLPRDGGASVSLADFAGAEPGALFLPARRHSRLY